MKIEKVAEKFNIPRKNLSFYGDYMAKVENSKGKKNGKLVLVTAMTSNKFGVGKTTLSIGLADAMNLQGRNTLLALREPSMGPVFGVKGGATGGGKASLSPSDEINLHFTGDFHAIAQANNLLSSIIDNHIFQGNTLGIDTEKIYFKRCLDVNDRSLREITYKIGKNTVTTGFNITAASEVMAILCLSEDIKDLKKNLGNILVAQNIDGKPVYAKDLNAEESMAVLLKDAFKPNLVQTIEGNLALVHLGPFANIAHGCNSIVATKYALTHADYCVTEAGFGSDLGGEKFLDITDRVLKKTPDAVVLIVTIGVMKEQGSFEKGLENVERHIYNLKDVFKANLVVAINKHKGDTAEEITRLVKFCEEKGVEVSVCEAFDKGGKGCLDLANKVSELCDKKSQIQFTYSLKDSIKDKIEAVATKIYGAKSVEYSQLAQSKIDYAESLGLKDFYVNIAKTQFSFSDDKNLLGAPRDFVFKVTDLEIRSGAKMIVAICGNMLLMPGLAKVSNYNNIKIDKKGKIEGIF